MPNYGFSTALLICLLTDACATKYAPGYGFLSVFDHKLPKHRLRHPDEPDKPETLSPGLADRLGLEWRRLASTPTPRPSLSKLPSRIPTLTPTERPTAVPTFAPTKAPAPLPTAAQDPSKFFLYDLPAKMNIGNTCHTLPGCTRTYVYSSVLLCLLPHLLRYLLMPARPHSHAHVCAHLHVPVRTYTHAPTHTCIYLYLSVRAHTYVYALIRTPKATVVHYCVPELLLWAGFGAKKVAFRSTWP